MKFTCLPQLECFHADTNNFVSEIVKSHRKSYWSKIHTFIKYLKLFVYFPWDKSSVVHTCTDIASLKLDLSFNSKHHVNTFWYINHEDQFTSKFITKHQSNIHITIYLFSNS